MGPRHVVLRDRVRVRVVVARCDAAKDVVRRVLTADVQAVRVKVGRLVVVLSVCEPRHLRVRVVLLRQVVDERDLRTRATPGVDSCSCSGQASERGGGACVTLRVSPGLTLIVGPIGVFVL